MPPARALAAIALLALAATAAPVAGHGSQKQVQREVAHYNVTFITSTTIVGGEETFFAWEVRDQQRNGSHYNESAPADVTFYDADNATLGTRQTKANATDYGDRTLLVASTTVPEPARWVDYTLVLPDAEATFGQAVDPPPGAEDDSDDASESTPLGGAVAVAAVAVGWLVVRRRSDGER